MRAILFTTAVISLGYLTPLMAHSSELPSWWEQAQVKVVSGGGDTPIYTPTPSNANLSIFIPNTYNKDNTKFIYIDLWLYTTPSINVHPKDEKSIVSWTYDGATLAAPISTVKCGDLMDWERHCSLSATIFPQPKNETFIVSWDTYSDVKIDPKFSVKWEARTYCTPVPEPDSVSLAVVGLLISTRFSRFGRTATSGAKLSDRA